MVSWRSVVGIMLMVTNTSFAVAAEGNGLPQIKSRVNDHAAVLSRNEMNRLYQLSAQHQFATKNHLVVVTAESAGGEAVEVYARRVWNAWQPNDRPNSVMLLLIKEPKGSAIIAGDALSRVLNEATIKRIIDERVSTMLIKDEYDAAAEEGLSAIAGELNR